MTRRVQLTGQCLSLSVSPHSSARLLILSATPSLPLLLLHLPPPSSLSPHRHPHLYHHTFFLLTLFHSLRDLLVATAHHEAGPLAGGLCRLDLRVRRGPQDEAQQGPAVGAVCMLTRLDIHGVI